LENEDHPGTPEKRDGSTYLQSTKDVNKNLLKRTTNYGSSAAKRSSGAWEKEAHQLKAPEMRESGQFYQLSANEVRKTWLRKPHNNFNSNSQRKPL